VNVGDKLRAIPCLTPILAPEVFASAHLAAWGGSVEWFDTEFGADNLYAWAKEQAGLPSHEQFDAWMRRNQRSLTTAAEALGLSRRMVSYYRTAQRPIPKTVWLACVGCDYHDQSRRLSDSHALARQRSLPQSGNFLKTRGRHDMTPADIHANHLEASNASFRRKNSAYRRRTNTYAKSISGLQRTLDMLWIVHNFIRSHFTTKQVPAVALGILQQGLSWDEVLGVRQPRL